MRTIALLLIFAAQETFIHKIPPGCTATVDATQVTIICPPVAITTPIALPPATAKSPYTADLAALTKPTGGVAPYSFTLAAGPAWMALSTAGIISGTPTVSGTFNFSFAVMDSSGTLTQVRQGSFDVAQNPGTRNSGR
jgi:hypothetical protein